MRSEAKLPGRPVAVPGAARAATPALGQALAEHREELEQALKQAKKDLEAWRHEHGGFDSMTRVGAAAGKLVGDLVHGKVDLGGVAQTATDAETLERAPVRRRIESLEKRLAEVNEAAAAVRAGRPLGTGAAFRDYRVAELARQQSGAELTPAELMQGRLGFLERAEAPEDQAEAYVAALEPYLRAPAANGQSLQTLANGQASPAGWVNQLILLGLVPDQERLVVDAASLQALGGALQKLREDPKGVPEKLKKVLEGLTPEALQKEQERLSALGKDPQLQQLAPAARAVQEAADKLAQRQQKGLLERSVSAVGRILDSPETWAMMAVGSLVSGTGARLLFGGRGTAAELIAAKRSHALTAGLVGRFAAGGAVDGALFQVGMNGFNLLRQKPQHAAWGADDFARSIALFEVLGAVGINARARATPETMAGKLGNSARFFGEEVAALSGLAVGEGLIRDGSVHHVGDLLEQNAQFLVAMRMAGGLAKLNELRKAQRQSAGLPLLAGPLPYEGMLTPRASEELGRALEPSSDPFASSGPLAELGALGAKLGALHRDAKPLTAEELKTYQQSLRTELRAVVAHTKDAALRQRAPELEKLIDQLGAVPPQSLSRAPLTTLDRSEQGWTASATGAEAPSMEGIATLLRAVEAMAPPDAPSWLKERVQVARDIVFSGYFGETVGSKAVPERREDYFAALYASELKAVLQEYRATADADPAAAARAKARLLELGPVSELGRLESEWSGQQGRNLEAVFGRAASRLFPSNGKADGATGIREYVPGGDLFSDPVRLRGEVNASAAKDALPANRLEPADLEAIALGMPGLVDRLRTALLQIARVDKLEDVGKAGPLDASGGEGSLFKALFGRDSIKISRQTQSAFPEVGWNTILRLAEKQGTQANSKSDEEPGRILHEYRPKGDPIGDAELVPKWGELPYYGTVDATPNFVNMVAEYVQQHGPAILDAKVTQKDGKEVTIREACDLAIDWVNRRLDTAIGGGLAWVQRSQTDGIPFQSWIDAADSRFLEDGTIIDRDRPHIPLQDQGFFYRGLRNAAALSRASGKIARADELDARAAKLKDKVIERFWLDDLGVFSPTLVPDKFGEWRPVRVVSSEAWTLLDSRLLDDHPQLRDRLVQALVDEKFGMIGKGGVLTKSSNKEFNARWWPASYQNGSSWPHDTKEILDGLRRYGYDKLANDLELRILYACIVNGGFPEYVKGLKDSAPVNKEVVDIVEPDGFQNRLEQPPQDPQGWTVSSVFGLLYDHGIVDRNLQVDQAAMVRFLKSFEEHYAPMKESLPEPLRR